VLFIGLATGITSGAALDHPSVERLEVVELIADVARGAKLSPPRIAASARIRARKS
jgi:spermidine synthase